MTLVKIEAQVDVDRLIEESAVVDVNELAKRDAVRQLAEELVKHARQKVMKGTYRTTHVFTAYVVTGPMRDELEKKDAEIQMLEDFVKGIAGGMDINTLQAARRKLDSLEHLRKTGEVLR